jgi:hypothetical protein
LRDEFQVDLPLSDLFEAPTVAELTQRLDIVRLVDPNLADASNAGGDHREVIEI